MKTCPYCGSDVVLLTQQQYYCDFCCMALDKMIVKENCERIDVRFKDFVLDAQMDKTTPEIMALSTFELLNLLKVIRRERNDMYHFMSSYYRIGQAGIDISKESEKELGMDYVYFTKKVFIVENIIRTRLGYVPNRITENFLVRYLDEIKKDKRTGPMIIRTQRQRKEE